MLAFYLMPTRAWQFAAGALAWLLAQHLRPSLAQAKSASWLGLGLLVLSLIAVDASTLYPSMWALLPTMTSMALLWAGSTDLLTRLEIEIFLLYAVDKMTPLLLLVFWHWQFW